MSECACYGKQIIDGVLYHGESCKAAPERITVMTDLEKWTEAVSQTVKILKVRFGNLSVEETVRIAHEIVKVTFAAYSEKS